MSMEEREDPTTELDEDVEGHGGRTRDASDEDVEGHGGRTRDTSDEDSSDVEGHGGRTREAMDEGDDVEGHARTR